MNYKTLLFIGFFLVDFYFIDAQITVPGNTMGLTKGTASVNDVGAATYSINIDCAAGLGGLQPHLNLTYSSQAGNGPLGFGWCIQGISAISRSGRTWSQDGGIPLINYINIGGLPTVENTINFDNFDRFALDGEELKLAFAPVQSTTSPNYDYGTKNSIYYTEQNSFQKVVLVDTLNGSPTYFKVFSKDGLIKEFGNSPDSKILLNSNNLPIHWFLNKVSDRNGNYIKYSYVNNLVTGEYYPIKIEYSGNSNTNKPTCDSIVFVYQPNAAPSIKYLKGAPQKVNSTRISEIDCYSYGKTIRKYNFTYVQNSLSTFSQLTKIQEFGSDGVGLSPIMIAWNNPSVNYQGGASNLIDSNMLNVSNGKQILTGDFNGDGLTDIMSYDSTNGNNTFYVCKGTGKNGNLSFSSFSNLIQPNSILKGVFQTVDFNADGKTDLFFKDSALGDVQFFLTDFKSNTLILNKQNLNSRYPLYQPRHLLFINAA